MIYLSGCSNLLVREAASNHRIGLMTQPGNSLHRQIPAFRWWAADNGCFNAATYLGDEAWLAWLDTLPRARCLFATAPDVMGDAAATWERSAPFLPIIRSLGFPAALVAQNGFDLDAVDWDAFDALFIGGDDTFKLSPLALTAAAIATGRGKWAHLGRVNSWLRIHLAAWHGFDSTDGTFLKWTRRRLPEVISWLERLELQPFLFDNRTETTKEHHPCQEP